MMISIFVLLRISFCLLLCLTLLISTDNYDSDDYDYNDKCIDEDLEKEQPLPLRSIPSTNIDWENVMTIVETARKSIPKCKQMYQ